MSLVFRQLPRCDRCESHVMCDFIRQECERTVARIERVAKLAGHKTPDAELVLDCETFWASGKGHGAAKPDVVNAARTP